MRNKEEEITRTQKIARAISVARTLKRMYPREKVFLEHHNPFELLVAVILSAQCTDRRVNQVTQKLFKKYKKLEDYIAAGSSRHGIQQFEYDIRSTGFFRSKAKYILQSAKIIHRKHKGKVPSSMEELLCLPGVGRKTANIVLESAFGIVEGIPVDTHVFRITRILNLSKSKTPDGVERDLCDILPKRYWPKFSYRMISYGREFCPARKHNHSMCPLSRIRV